MLVVSFTRRSACMFHSARHNGQSSRKISKLTLDSTGIISLNKMFYLLKVDFLSLFKVSATSLIIINTPI